MGINSGIMKPEAMDETRARADAQIFNILNDKQEQGFRNSP